MITVSFNPLKGNTAPAKQVRKVTELNRCKDLASKVFEKLGEIEGLNTDEKAALEYIKKLNKDLQFTFAQCKDSDKALTQYSHIAKFGDKTYYSIENPTVTVFELLSNLATGYRLYKAAKIVSDIAEKQAGEKPKLFKDWINPQAAAILAAMPAVKPNLVSQYIDWLRSLQVTEGTIKDLCKKSEIDYIAPAKAK